MPRVYMQSDEGNRSAGHVYAVSDKEYARLTKTRVKARLTEKMGRGRRAVERPIALAIPATDEHMKPAAARAEPEPTVACKMLVDLPKFSAGRVYHFGAKQADRLCDGYKAGGRRMRPVAVRVDSPTPPKRPFSAEKVSGVSPRVAKALAEKGLSDPELIAAASPGDLQGIRGLGKKTAVALIQAATEYLR